MYYKNSIMFFNSGIIKEIIFDNFLYCDKNFNETAKENAELIFELDEEERIILNNNNKLYEIRDEIPLELNNYEGIFFHFKNNRKLYKIKNKNSITIGNTISNDIKFKTDNNFNLNREIIDIRIENKKLYNLSRNIIFLNGIFEANDVIELKENDVIFLYGLKITYLTDDILIEGNKNLYTCYLIEKDLNETDFKDKYTYKRTTRIIKRVPQETVNFKSIPLKGQKIKNQLLRRILPPVIMAVITAAIGFILRRGLFLIVSIAGTIMTVIISIVTYFSDKKEAKRKEEKRKKVVEEYFLSLRKELNGLRKKQIEALHYQNPSLEEITMLIKNRSNRIYERSSADDDFLVINIGTDKIPASYKISMNREALELEEDKMKEELKNIYNEYKSLDNMPVTIDLKKAHLGLVGDIKYLHEQLNLLFSQLTFFHSYHELEIIFIYNEEFKKDFKWLRWYPHFKIHSINARGMVNNEIVRDQIFGSLTKILKDRKNNGSEKNIRFMPHYLFVIDEPDLILNTTLMEFMQEKTSDFGFSIIYTSGMRANIPENIKTIITLDNYNEGTILINEGIFTNRKIKLNHIPDSIKLEELSRNLSFINHINKSFNQLPESITFFEMYGVKKPDELNINEKWKQNQSYKTLAVPIGIRGREDYVYLNLHEKAHGPHGLIAGTTGSGKSELIQTFILSLAVNYHPYEVGFLLIDYKGGGMAALFKNLPHVLGIITNLDGSESMRALISIKSELERRQKIFNKYNVNHINQYNKLFKLGKTEEPLPHLFLISDEFAELKKEQPDFMNELISTARIGRSLGVHLILATQKPSGVVNEQIWSNSKFKIALKVQDEADSKEILKTPDAAYITQTGRAYMQIGNNEIYELFQSAWSGASYDSLLEEKNELDNRVYLINELGQGELLNKDFSVGREDLNLKETELDVTVNYIKKLFDSLNCPRVRRTWLPPLKEKIVSPYIDENFNKDTDKFELLDTNVNMGIIDIPENQMQSQYSINFEKEGNLLVFSSAGYGKTTTLTTVLLSLAVKNAPKNLQVFILDLGNAGLISLKNLPHVRDYITTEDKVKFNKFQDIILDEMAERKKLMSLKSAANFSLYNQISEEKLSAIFIFIDNYDAIKEVDDYTEDFILKVARDGLSLGIHLVASASRQNAMRIAIFNNYRNKIVHYMNDQTDVRAIVGKSNYKLPEIPGRAAIKLENVNIMQMYIPVSYEKETEYSRKIIKLVENIKNNYTGKPLENIKMMPEELTYELLMQYAGKPEDKKLVIGLEFNNITARGITTAGGIKLILGAQQTGKTNVLKLILKQTSGKKVFLADLKDSELYPYKDSVLKYIGNQNDMESFTETLKEITKNRKEKFEEARKNGTAAVPKLYFAQQEDVIVLIDDIDSFIASAAKVLGNKESKTVFAEAVSAGITFIATAPLTALKGFDEVTRLFKGTVESIILGNPNDQTTISGVYLKHPEEGIDLGYIYNKGITEKVKIPQV